MNFQREELWRILTDKGWEIEVTDNYDFQRWSSETWLLRSIWSQVGTTAYLAFKLDEMEIRPEKESLEELLVQFFTNLGGDERSKINHLEGGR